MSKTDSKNMYRKANYNKNGKLISYRLVCSYKDFFTQRHKNNTKTWKVPAELTGKKEIQRALNQEIENFRLETKALEKGRQVKKGKGFIDYARNDWLPTIIRAKSKSYAHRAIQSIDVFEKYFGLVTFDQLSPDMVKSFFKELMNKDIHQTKILLKKSIWPLITERYSTKNEFCKRCDISRTTLLEAEKGAFISKESMYTIIHALNLNKSEYFTIIDDEPRYYKKESILKHKRIMCTIFNSAIRDMYLDDNYTSNKYMKLQFQEDNDDGKVKPENVLNFAESKAFIDALNKVSDPRIKAYFSILLFSGMRSCELNGLKWRDIDFEKTIAMLSGESSENIELMQLSELDRIQITNAL